MDSSAVLSRARGQAGTGGLQWPERVCPWVPATQLSLARLVAAEQRESFVKPAGHRSQLRSESRDSKAGEEERKGAQARGLYVSIPSLFAPRPWKLLQAPHKVMQQTQKTYCTAKMEEIKQRRVQLSARSALFLQN